MDRFYEDAGSLFVEAYDLFYDGDQPQIAGDVVFYERLAREAHGPVLELGCGTGRIALALGGAGLEVTGVDISEGMLTVARQSVRELGAEHHLKLVRQDMSELDLDQRFAFAFIPFRSFQHLLTVELQRKSLGAVRRHLDPGGRLALHLFDPRLDLLMEGADSPSGYSGTHPTTRHLFVADVTRTEFDYLAQIRRDLWRYREYRPDGSVCREGTREMALRWTYRWELRHLLEACGFEVEAEYSDFDGSAPAYGRELIVVASPR